MKIDKNGETYRLTAADYADTGQWKLRIHIYPDGIRAYLKNTLHKDLPEDMLFEENWTPDETVFLSNIENAVYEHPQVLEDYSAEIIIYENRLLFIPTEMVEDKEGYETECYIALYPSDEENIFTDEGDGIIAVYSSAPGLKSFLSRTFPGARISSNLMRRVKSQLKLRANTLLNITIRRGEADFVLTKNEELLSATSRQVTSEEDILYFIFNLADVYGLDPKEIKITTEGEEISEKCKKFLRQYTDFELKKL